MICLPLASFGQSQRTFDSAQAAAEAAINAAEKNDAAELSAIFGPRGKEIVTTGDPKQDQNERAEFARLARSQHQLQPDPLNPERVTLSIGAEDWPFPIPIVRTNGKWSFDASQGAVEMRARRIGANELDAIEICAGYVEAQREYAAQDRNKHGMLEYAQRVMSSPGKHDGLYWEGSSQSLAPKRFAEATVEGTPGGAAKGRPYHGYYFRVLKSQGPNGSGGQHNYVVKDSMIGGFGLVAWPAEYGVTGIHTFIVNHDGVIYEKDLGKAAAAVTRYDPDKSWTRVD
jgi:hypothetical protein